jgi:hypothetical protein
MRPVSCALALAALVATPAVAAEFDFVAAPQRDLNRVYRVDRITL